MNDSNYVPVQTTPTPVQYVLPSQRPQRTIGALDILGLAVLVWLLFFGGCQKLSGALQGAKGQPVVETLRGLTQATPAVSAGPAGRQPFTPGKIPPPIAQRQQGIGPITNMPTLPTATPLPATAVPPGIYGVAGAPNPSNTGQQQVSAEEALQLWQEMADMCDDLGCSPAPGAPTAEVPTECQNPTTVRAQASCKLIKEGVIHPKG